MPEHTEDQKTKNPHKEDQPIDDMLDGKDVYQWGNQFGQVVSYIHASLFEDYLKHDTRAMDNQKWHRWAARITIGAGTITILLSLIGVVLEAQGSHLGIVFSKNISQYFWNVELAFFVVAVGFVFIGRSFTHWHENWLLERFCAEEYRTQKFRALFQSSLFCNPEKPWSERYSLWKSGFDDEVHAAKNEKNKSVGECIMSDTVSAPPPNTSGCRFDEEYLRELVNYYHDKRLTTQIEYFDNRFDKLENQDNLFRKILEGGFYLSIFLVAIRLAIGSNTLNFLGDLQGGNTLILLIMLSLPIIAFAVRTLRSSTEVARSASLYRVKRNVLEDFRNRFFIETERSPRNWEEIVKILWECENHLEEANREWLRIMNEAEWFV